MSKITTHISMSLDGYVAGPNQTADEPLGERGERLHDWAFADNRSDTDVEVRERALQGVGAFIMGRKMFAGEGPWDPEWKGWWGEDPPYHAPVYVLTHNARDPQPMEGGTTFHFVNDGIESALSQAVAAAGSQDVQVAGGASTVNQYLRAGLLDELSLHIAPIVLGAGERLFVDVGEPRLEPVEVIASPAVTHVRYRVER